AESFIVRQSARIANAGQLAAIATWELARRATVNSRLDTQHFAEAAFDAAGKLTGGDFCHGGLSDDCNRIWAAFLGDLDHDFEFVLMSRPAHRQLVMRRELLELKQNRLNL